MGKYFAICVTLERHWKWGEEIWYIRRKSGRFIEQYQGNKKVVWKDSHSTMRPLEMMRKSHGIGSRWSAMSTLGQKPEIKEYPN